MVALSINNLTKSYGGVPAVDDLDLDIKDGELVSLLGPSGCGKTTTLRCIAGLESSDEGEILAGDDVMVSTARGIEVPPERRNIGMVFQSYALWPHMTVYGNVAYPLRCRRVKTPEVRRRVRETVELVGLGHLLDRSVTALSGGQQQRVALARALVAEPRFLLFDEPLSNLDATLRATMRTEIRALHSRLGRTSVYVTHDQLEALTVSDRIAVMNGGKIEQLGTPNAVYSSPRTRFVAKFVGYENLFDATVIGRRGDRIQARLSGESDDVVTCLDNGAPEGATIGLAVRATSVNVSATEHGDGNSLAAGVRSVAYLGDQLEMTLGTAYGTVIAKVAPGQGLAASLMEVGQRCYVSLPGDSLVSFVE
jgi:iron(III) transport system ATP-binding protein